jgi:uncharacterized membrane protein
MGGSSRVYLSKCSQSLKILITCVVLTIGIGYSVSLLQVYNRGSFNIEKTVIHFRGGGDDPEGIHLPQGNQMMISVAHVHTFSQPVVLALIGLLFALTVLSEGFKAVWILASFLGSLAMNASPWLIRDVSPRFVYLLSVGGGVMILSFMGMAFFILKEVWLLKGGNDV